MKSVGIKQLKTKLSKMVARAAAGEQVMVTERGEPVAILCPLPPEIKVFLELRRKGRLRWSGGKPEIRLTRKWRPGDKNPDVSGAVIQNRDDEARRF